MLEFCAPNACIPRRDNSWQLAANCKPPVVVRKRSVAYFGNVSTALQNLWTHCASLHAFPPVVVGQGIRMLWPTYHTTSSSRAARHAASN
eukprot:1866743-Rhodomonas_salina.2